MSVNIQTSHVLILCSTALGISGNVIALWVFLSLGILAAICRFAMEQSDKQDQQKRVDDSVDQLKEAASDFSKAFGDNFKGFS